MRKLLQGRLSKRLNQAEGNNVFNTGLRPLARAGGIVLGVLSAACFVGSLCVFLPSIHAASDHAASDKDATDKNATYNTNPADQEARRKAYADQVGQSYNFAFGKGKLSVPGNGAVEGNTFLQPDAFPNASYCGHCHQEAYHQWQQSLHRNSFRTPFYRASVNILLNTKGIQFTRHCDSCHNPIAVLAGWVR